MEDICPQTSSPLVQHRGFFWGASLWAQSSKCQPELKGRPGVCGRRGVVGRTRRSFSVIWGVGKPEAGRRKPASWLVATPPVQGSPRPGGTDVGGLGVSEGSKGG